MDIKEVIKFLTLNVNTNKPCSEEEIYKFEVEKKIQLSKSLKHLYRYSNGTTRKLDTDLIFHLMSIEEVQELLSFSDWQAELQENLQDDEKICALWSDGNSNYAAIYISGLLNGKICFIDHEEIDLSPVFRDIFSFYQSVFDVHKINLQQHSEELGWWEVKTDYPRLGECEDKFYSEDISLAEKFIELFRAETNYVKKQHLAFCAMNLLPFSETHKILEFINSDDMWIQERACKILGKKKYEKAVPILADVALNGTHNGRIAAMNALRNFNTRESNNQIERLFNKLEDGYKIYLKLNYQKNL